MEKPAESKYALHDLVRRRWSPRAFGLQPVEKEKLGALLDAARWAASSSNEQPWRFLVGEKGTGTTHARIFECLSPGNQPWAGAAPLLVLVCAVKQWARDGSENPHALYDCGLSVGNLTTQATALNLWVHQMAGFDGAKARTAFALPDSMHPLVVLAVGYAGDPQGLPEKKRAAESAPRTRKPLSEIAFTEALGQPWL